MATTTKVRITPYVDWSAIIAGTVIAGAVSLLLAHFGAALGYTYEQFGAKAPGSTDAVWHGFIILGLWTLWTQLMASMAGGYTAGRTRRGLTGPTHEAEIRDGAHGALTWALSTVITAAAFAIVTFWASLAQQHGVVAPHGGLPPITAHKLAVVWSFSLTAFSLVSAVAAWWMGTVGGDHRDRAVNVSHHISFRTKRR